MDGHFAPNLTFGPKAIAAINRSTETFLEVHAMIYDPYRFVEPFVEAGADRIIIHFESTEDVEEILSYIRRCGIQAGLAFSPGTSIEFAVKFIPLCDLILVMAVVPGFCAQKFLSDTPDRVEFVRRSCRAVWGATEYADSFLIEVDGGINPDTGRLCAEAGANVLVSADYLFAPEGGVIKDKIARLHDILR